MIINFLCNLGRVGIFNKKQPNFNDFADTKKSIFLKEIEREGEKEQTKG